MAILTLGSVFSPGILSFVCCVGGGGDSSDIYKLISPADI